MRKISIIVDSNPIKKYPNIKNPFQIIGIDIMITEDFKPILIECNGRPGFAGNYDIGIDLQQNFFNFISRNALEPLFGLGDSKTDIPLYVSS